MPCSICKKEYEEVLRSEIMPDDLFDDAVLAITTCPSQEHEAFLTIIQSERRGTLDDETIDKKRIPITFQIMKYLQERASACPQLMQWNCTCDWHLGYTAPHIISKLPTFERKPWVDFRWTDDEEGIYHYGRY